MFRRNLTRALLAALSDTPIVFLGGARQTGKSTLVQGLAKSSSPARYLTFDDATVLAAAKADPVGFLSGAEGPIVLDEIQRVPELFLPLKAEADRDRRPGRFLLTGSANALLLPNLADALVGRLEPATLWPLSQGELEGVEERFIDRIFEPLPLSTPPAPPRADLIRRLVRGGFPEVVQRADAARRAAWFASFVTTLLQRDVRDVTQVAGLALFPRLLAMLAARSSTLLNVSELARSMGMAGMTLRRYLALLEATWMVQLLPAWSANLGKRLVRAPKVALCDTGLAAHLLGADESRLASDSELLGRLLESFVVQEVRKQLGWSRRKPALFHFRSHAGDEIDLILDDRSGEIVGIEVKAASTIAAEDFRALKRLSATVPDRFRRGVVLYLGRETVAFGRDLVALPVSALWQIAA